MTRDEYKKRYEAICEQEDALRLQYIRDVLGDIQQYEPVKIVINGYTLIGTLCEVKVTCLGDLKFSIREKGLRVDRTIVYNNTTDKFKIERA